MCVGVARCKAWMWAQFGLNLIGDRADAGGEGGKFIRLHSGERSDEGGQGVNAIGTQLVLQVRRRSVEQCASRVSTPLTRGVPRAEQDSKVGAVHRAIAVQVRCS